MAFALLTVMVVIHELGHFIAGRRLGFKVSEFAIGMGPKLYKKRLKSGMLFTFRLLPIGGFCAFEGDDDLMTDADKRKFGVPDETPEETDEEKRIREENRRMGFNNQSPPKRIAVLLSGVLFNFVSAIILLSLFFSISGKFMPLARYDDVSNLQANAACGDVLFDEDIILKVNGKHVNILDPSDLTKLLSKAGDSADITVLRNGEKVDFHMQKGDVPYDIAYPKLNLSSIIKEGDRSILVSINGGPAVQIPADITLAEKLKKLEDMMSVDDEAVVTLKRNDKYKAEIERVITYTIKKDKLNDDTVKNDYEIIYRINEKGIDYRYGFASDVTIVKFGFFDSIAHAVRFSFFTAGKILGALGGLFTGFTKIGQDTGGPATLISSITEVISYGDFWFVVYLVCLISVNLAIFNILPLPALDGGRIVFVILEWIRKKPINRNVEALIHFIGIIALLGMAILFDVVRYLR